MENQDSLVGRELDAAVAEGVMGFVRHRHGVLLPNDNRLSLWFDNAMKSEADQGNLFLRVPPYSTDIALAMQVLERADGLWELSRFPYREDSANESEPFTLLYSCRLRFGDNLGSATGITLPEVICRSALNAVKATE